LLELSLVAVPCNPNAIQNAYRGGYISKNMYEFISKIDDSQNNSIEEENELNKEEVQALIGETITPLKDEIKSLKEGNEAKDSTIKSLEEQIKELKEIGIIKTGAALSNANHETLKSIHKSMQDCTTAMKEFLDAVKKDDPAANDETDGEKNVTDAEMKEISELAAKQVAEIIKNLK
jgi:hypothetical protein